MQKLHTKFYGDDDMMLEKAFGNRNVMLKNIYSNVDPENGNVAFETLVVSIVEDFQT